MTLNPRIIVALDVPDTSEALRLASQLDPSRCRLKIGSELYTAVGPSLVETLQSRGFEVFLDLKFHDIPNTVAAACRVAAGLGVWMVDVHAQGGRAMLEAAREAVDAADHQPLLIAISVLTSLDEPQLTELGISASPQQQVARLASLAQAVGFDGMVCSPVEVALLRRQWGHNACLVTPGIRPAGSAPDDQRRTLTPLEALTQGASYLVVGRPITRAPDPAAALEAMHADLSSLGS